MEDFIRPNHNPEPKLKPKKTKHIRETLFIVCMFVWQLVLYLVM